MARLPFYTDLYVWGVLGCDFLEPKSHKEPVARVNDTYLYQEDIQALDFRKHHKAR